MRKGLFTMLAAVVLFLPSTAVYADLVVNPSTPDPFVDSHKKECKDVFETYLVDSEDGFVVFMVNPESPEVLWNVMNGAQIRVERTYTKEDEVWGFGAIEWGGGAYGFPGWFLMDGLTGPIRPIYIDSEPSIINTENTPVINAEYTTVNQSLPPLLVVSSLVLAVVFVTAIFMMILFKPTSKTKE